MATTPPTTTYDLTNGKKVYIDEEVNAVIATSNTLLSVLPPFITSQELGENKQVYWSEDYQVYNRDTLNNGGAVAAADTSFVVTDATKFAVGMEIKFRDYKEVMLVTAVNTGTNTLTVTRSYGTWAAPTTVADESYIDIIANPKEELSRAVDEGVDETSNESNYYQTFRKDVPISEQARYMAMYGPDKERFIAYVLDRKTRELNNEMARSFMYGVGNVGTKTTGSKVQGIVEWLGQAGTNKTDAASAALTATFVNNVLEDIYQDDNELGELIIYANPYQARKMALFNTAVSNRFETANFDDRAAAGGTFKTQFIGDLPMVGRPGIFIDKDAPKDSLLILNRSKIQPIWSPNGAPQMWDSKPNDAPPDSMRMSMMWTASLIMKDHKYSHGMIYNLATS